MEPFQSLHPRDEALIEKLREFIRERGALDDRFRVAVWRLKDKEEGILVDGYNRFEAAELENLRDIPCELLDFDGVEQAETYARRSEERRHISDKNLIKLASKGLKILDLGEKKGPRALSVAQITEKAGVSPRKAKRTRRVLRHPELAREVCAGRKSIRQAEAEIGAKAKKKRNPKTTDRELITLAESLLEQARAVKQKFDEGKLNGDPLALVWRAIRCLKACLPKHQPRTGETQRFIALARDLSQIKDFQPDKKPQDALAYFVNKRMELFDGDPGVIEVRRDTRLMKDALVHLALNGRKLQAAVDYYLEEATYMGARRGWDVRGFQSDLQEIMKEVPRGNPEGRRWNGVPDSAAMKRNPLP